MTLLDTWCSKSGALWLTWSFAAPPLVFSAILLKWRTWRRQIAGQRSVTRYICVHHSRPKRKKKSGRRKERKCKPSTKPDKNPRSIRNKEKKKEIFSANTCFLKNTVCVWKTQSCLSAVHFKELCLIFHSSLRKHVKVSPVAFGQGLTSTEVFH